jgi:DNA-binding CsgD family transcriptional regulator
MHLTSTPVRSIHDDLSAQLESLVRRIVEEGNSPPPQHIEMPASAFDGAAVVLGLEVDGVPYWLVQRPAPAVPAVPATGRACISLSPREREIVRLVAKGLPNKAIADVLDISLWTVATHLRRIFAKLGVGTRAEMIARVIGDGLLDGSAGAPDE